MKKTNDKQSKLASEIWKVFKNYCLTHNYYDEDFNSGLIALVDLYHDKYFGTSMFPLQKHLWVGLINSLHEDMKGNKNA